jgi:hypothetical protein
VSLGCEVDVLGTSDAGEGEGAEAGAEAGAEVAEVEIEAVKGGGLMCPIGHRPALGRAAVRSSGIEARHMAGRDGEEVHDNCATLSSWFALLGLFLFDTLCCCSCCTTPSPRRC